MLFRSLGRRTDTGQWQLPLPERPYHKNITGPHYVNRASFQREIQLPHFPAKLGLQVVSSTGSLYICAITFKQLRAVSKPLIPIKNTPWSIEVEFMELR